ncbi:MAG: hypothetical protein SGJ11_01330 [Phycisphaerae bacterium]|nr:hypothetical protein [Phycisphaerae bacterium]
MRYSRRSLLLAALAVGLPWIAMFLTIRVIAPPSRSGAATSTRMLLGLGGSIALSIIAMLIVKRRHDRRRARAEQLLRERDGLVCPWCLGVPSVRPTDPHCCAQMPIDWTERDFLEYWTLAKSKPMTAAKMLVRDSDLVNPRSLWMPWVMTLSMSVFVAINAVFREVIMADGLAGLLSMLPMVLVGYAGDLLIRGFGLWRGGLACAKCGYWAEGLASAERCPECGHAWRSRTDGLTRHRRVVRWAPLLVGCCILLPAGWLMLARPNAAMTMLRRMQSTTALTAAADLGGFRSSSQSAWAEITRRTLSAQESGSLFDQLLEERSGAGTLFGVAQGWMAAHIASGAPTPEQMRRLRRESFMLKLTAPSRTRVGAKVTVQLGGDRSHEFLPPAVGVAVLVGGAFFADQPDDVVGRTDVPLFVINVDDRFGTSEFPAITLRADKPGNREIVAPCWLLARPYGQMTKPITWNADGTPQIPADALWSEAVEIRHRIQVEP